MKNLKKNNQEMILFFVLVVGIFAIVGCSRIQIQGFDETVPINTGNAVCDLNYGCNGDELSGFQDENDDDNDDLFRVPLSDVSSTLKKYSFIADNSITVNFFVVKGSDGKIRTAFDACDVCGGRKGYRQQGNDVICNNCGRSFKISDLGTKNVGGGCWPSYLEHKIEGGEVLIKKSDLSDGAFRFA